MVERLRRWWRAVREPMPVHVAVGLIVAGAVGAIATLVIALAPGDPKWPVWWVAVVASFVSLALGLIGLGLGRMSTLVGQARPRLAVSLVALARRFDRSAGVTVAAPVSNDAHRRAEHVLDEHVASVRLVRDEILAAMSAAEEDREFERDESRSDAIASATKAVALAGEIGDFQAQQLVIIWKQAFDRIPKGWRQRGGWPRDEFEALRWDAEQATTSLGRVIRELLADAK